jgi:lipopolysaccharide biosynthesis glycosyltransferase
MAEMYAVSVEQAKAYAKKYNAEYYTISTRDDFKPASGKHLDYQKLKMYDLKEHYDLILYLDCDYIIKDFAPNIFELSNNQFTACLDNGKSAPLLAERLKISPDQYFNAGFMCVPKHILESTEEKLLNEYIHKEYEFDGQGILNKLFFDTKINKNFLPASDWNNVAKTFGTYADHYAGAKKKKWGMVGY